MRPKALMVGGTASHVGKSWMATAICRWLHRQGIRVAPFKAQNMSNNSYPCPGGGEIGRAQVAQAEACGLAPSVDMNPVLLKPTSDQYSQVVVHGKVWCDLQARAYYQRRDYLFRAVQESYARLAAQYDYIVIEGAGSIAELNFRDTDLVNLGLARHLDVPVLLVADIDRGGVFASVYGTVALLDPAEARLVRAFAVNRFRGDPLLFVDGVRILQERAARPCLGVFPMVDIHLDAEDGVTLDDWKPAPADAPSVAILAFPRISNLTDCRLLTWAQWLRRPTGEQFDAILLPGSKSSVADLQWMRARGFDRWLREQHAGGARILGVCGGYQMLGLSLDDPDHVESPESSVPGLGMLPVRTVLRRDKITTVVRARTPQGRPFPAYEIHMGETTATGEITAMGETKAMRETNAAAVSATKGITAMGETTATVAMSGKGIRAVEPFAWVNGHPEGIRQGRCAGTYLHGALECPDVVEEWLGFRPPDPPSKETSYDALADWFESAADIPLFRKLYL